MPLTEGGGLGDREGLVDATNSLSRLAGVLLGFLRVRQQWGCLSSSNVPLGPGDPRGPLSPGKVMDNSV